MKHLEAVNKLDASTLHQRELYYRMSFNAYASNDLFEAVSILQTMLVEYPQGKYVFFFFFFCITECTF